MYNKGCKNPWAWSYMFCWRRNFIPYLLIVPFSMNYFGKVALFPNIYDYKRFLSNLHVTSHSPAIEDSSQWMFTLCSSGFIVSHRQRAQYTTSLFPALGWRESDFGDKYLYSETTWKQLINFIATSYWHIYGNSRNRLRVGNRLAESKWAK